jgi:hypothetical protein
LCSHSDSGFAHTERNFYSQLIFGESFEFGDESSWHYVHPSWDTQPAAATAGGLKWNSLVADGVNATIGYDKMEAHHGYASLKVEYTSGTGVAGVTNRGIGNEGLYLVAGKAYEGYFFAKADSAVKMVVMLRNYVTGTVLAQQEIAVSSTTEWKRFDFKLTTSATAGNATCEGIAQGSDPDVDCNVMRKGMAVPPTTGQGHVCIKCAGEFAIGLAAPGVAHVDYVFLQPGAWGR